MDTKQGKIQQVMENFKTGKITFIMLIIFRPSNSWNQIRDLDALKYWKYFLF